MALILSVGMVACGTASTEVKSDSTAVDSAAVVTDTTATQVVDTASVVK